MNKRLREARNALNLRQKDFAEKLFLKLSSYANWESGCSPIPQAKIPLICLTFGINETWLRTGEGEMLAAAGSTSTTNLPSPYESARAHGCSEAIAKIYARYCALPDEEKAIFERIVDSLVEEKVKRPQPDGGGIAINNVYGDNNTMIN